MQSKETDYVHVTHTSNIKGDAHRSPARPQKVTHQLDTGHKSDCKRVRATAPVTPEESVAALTLNELNQQQPQPQAPKTAGSLQLAKLLLSRGKPQNALLVLEAIITADTSDADALCLRGQCYLAEHDNVQVLWLCQGQVLLEAVTLVLMVATCTVGTCRHLPALLQL